MSDHWEVKIQQWPHSTGRGSKTDQEQAGARELVFHIRADDMKSAMNVATIICIGLKQNPIIYKTPIQSISCIT